MAVHSRFACPATDSLNPEAQPDSGREKQQDPELALDEAQSNGSAPDLRLAELLFMDDSLI